MLRWLTCSLTLAGLTGFATAQEEPEIPGIDWDEPRVEGEILYRLDVQATEGTRAAVGALVGAVEQEELWPGIIYKMVLPGGADLRAAIATLNADPRVRYAEPNYVVHAIGDPNDPDYDQQWGWDQDNDADIDAPEAWDLATDASDVLVAIIDTGINYGHPDLAANCWTNPGEIPGNGIDDDSNGYVDDVRGYDFANNDGNPNDDHSHGSHCAGTVGAVTDNGIGVAGACWNANMVGVKFLSSSGSGSTSDAIECFAYCVAIGAQLSNNSWGGGGYSQGMYDAIDLAGDAGHLAVFAAGNNGSNNDNSAFYPASYDLPEIISVAATDSSDDLASFSNYGATTVDLGAPGVGILSTVLGSGYSSYSGTSMACPHVCGVATMLFSVSGTSNIQEVKQILMDTVDPIPALSGRCITEGRLNYRSALEGVRPIGFVYPGGRPDEVLPAGGNTFAVQVQSASGSPVPGTLELHVDWGDGYQTVAVNHVGSNQYFVTFPGQPGTDCGATISYYFTAQADDLLTYSDPGGGASNPYTTTSVGSVVGLVDLDFEGSGGWTVSSTGLTDGAWDRGIPADGDRGDPPADADGSGQCWLTDNVSGNSDVDGGPTELLSAVYDLSTESAVICSYSRWFYSDGGAEDDMDVHVSDNGGSSWTLVETVTGEGGWENHQFSVGDFVGLTSQFRIRFSVSDNPNDSVTEAGVDAFELHAIRCDMSMAVTPSNQAIGGFVELTTWKGLPSGLCRMLVVAVDGSPVVIPLVLAPFDAAGDLSLGGNIPNNPALSGVSIDFGSFGIAPDGSLQVTNNATLDID